MKQSFNENWVCYRTGEKEKAFAVTLPHDAMQLDERSETSAGGVNIDGMRRRITLTRKHLSFQRKRRTRK